MKSPDVVIAGAGIIGLSLALELSKYGARVIILERDAPGQEASSAAAGMLAASDPETPYVLQSLARESARLYPEFVNMVERASGIKTDFRQHGTIAIGQVHNAPPEYRAISREELSRLEPSLRSRSLPVYLVQEGSVDPVLLVRAAVKAAELAGIEIFGQTEFRTGQASPRGIAVLTSHGTIQCKMLVNCCGAWSGAPVRPRKGQMLYLEPHDPELIQHVVRAPDAYIVPRSSGKILIGATVEDVGFDKTVEEETIERLKHAASKYLPELADAKITSSWAGLRPGTPDDLPIMGQTEAGIFIASGHYRNGILLAPATAKLMANLMMGRQPASDLTPFSPFRFGNAQLHSARG